MFLFFSGYGLTAQAKRRENYVKDMWKTRILPTYVIYLLVAAVYFLAVFLTGSLLSTSNLIRTFFFGGTVVRNGWYYPVFSAISRLFKGAKLKNKCLESHKQ